MSEQQGVQTLKFLPLQSCVDLSFWSELASRKLDEYQLSEAPINITGHYGASRHQEVASSVQLMASAFDSTSTVMQQGWHALPGRLINVNTLEAFQSLDKQQLLQQTAQLIWQDILSGAAEASPALLCRFLVLSFGDLKHFDFHYWFAFPALKPAAPFRQHGAAQPLSSAYSAQQVAQVCDACNAWRGLSDGLGSRAVTGANVPFWLVSLNPANDGSTSAEARPLSYWQQCHPEAAADSAGDQVLLAMSDPSHLPGVPGWPLRNLLLLVAVRWHLRRVKVLCVRDVRGRMDAGGSFVVDVELPAVPEGWGLEQGPSALGWEANSKGKLGPRHINTSATMSPLHLAEQAVDLNLRLMRWRAAPGLDVGTLATARCLLLGAGTLGCAVARTLLAWGVRSITFVDSGKVAYSNPVRQSLFVYEDCLEGGRPKAQAAAEHLAQIFPAVQAAGVQLSIPMPGHPPANDAAAVRMRQDAAQLAELVAAHDAVFLLTDTRESRWLPTLLCAAEGTATITAALGFDGLVVMRHGVPEAASAPAPASGYTGAAATEGVTTPAGQTVQEQQGQEQQEQPGTSVQQPEQQVQQASHNPQQQQQQQPVERKRLGCYFCNDVVAPLNSTIDRTLDQQCTVARPGLAPIAGALAVELLAALLQHPDGLHAPTGGSGGALGAVPHMIRAQLAGFSQVCMEAQAFSQCTACSDRVVQQYKQRGWDFLLEAIQQPHALEILTGLAELHAQAAAMFLDDDDADAATGTGAGSSRPAADGASADEDDWTEL